MNLQRLFAGVVLAATTLTLAAAAPVDILAQVKPGTPAKPAPAKVVQIVITNVAFENVNTPLRVGDIVEFVNKDSFDHTATAKNKDFDVAVPVGKKARVTLKRAGVIDYFCRYHPNMTGALPVRQ